MFRGSAYSIETDKDAINRSQLMEQQIRIAMVGVTDVGKSSMLACIENQKFRQDINNTKGIQLRFKKLRMNNLAINLYVWDGPGDKMNQFIQEGQFLTMDGILYVFDLSDKQSFYQLQQLHQQLKRNFQINNKQLCAVLVGNKADLINTNTNGYTNNINNEYKQIDFLADKFSKREQMLYLKVSAKHNSSVKDSFVELIKQILVGRSKGKTFRIFHDEEEIVGNNNNYSDNKSKNQVGPGCHCCQSFSPCSIF